MLYTRFQQCLGTSTMLLVEGSSENWICRHLSNHVFEVRNLRNIKATRVIFSSKYLQSNLDFKNTGKNLEYFFCFWNKCISIGIVKLSLLRTGYFSSGANALTSSTEIFHVNKRLFPTQLPRQLSMNMTKVVWRRLQQCFCTFTMLLVEGSSETWRFRHLSDYVFRDRRFRNRKSMRVIFFSKYSKFNLDFKNSAKNSEKRFVSQKTAHELVSLNCLY